jgi:hypothetical protein
MREPGPRKESPFSRMKRRAFSTYSQYTVKISESLTSALPWRFSSDSRREVAA